MKLDHLLSLFCHDIGDDNYAINEGYMLVHIDPNNKLGSPCTVELVALIEEDGEQFVVFNFHNVEDAVWFKCEGFDEHFDVYKLNVDLSV